jgi:hypothetical protein
MRGHRLRHHWGRNCLLLTQWTDHLDRLVSELRRLGHSPWVVRAGMGKKAQAAVIGELGAHHPAGGLLLVATGSFLGEGFDCLPLDTLASAMPAPELAEVVQQGGREPMARVLRTPSTVWDDRADPSVRIEDVHGIHCVPSGVAASCPPADRPYRRRASRRRGTPGGQREHSVSEGEVVAPPSQKASGRGRRVRGPHAGDGRMRMRPARLRFHASRLPGQPWWAS